MKKLFIACIMITGVLSSCLDESPAYTLNSKVVYESESAAQLSLNGIYGMLATQGGFAQLIPEINTEASGISWTSYNTSDNRCQYVGGFIPVANEFNDLVWKALYKTIANCNTFINSCNDPGSGSWINKSNMVAQAKFARAVCYYNLLVFYGGVPLRLDPSTTENINIPRASRQQVIDQITKDWSDAADDLNESSALASGTPTSPSKYGAYAYLTKLYWILGCNAWASEQGDAWANGDLQQSWPEMQSSHSYFSTAKTYGDLVLTKGGYELEGSLKTLFGGKRVTFSKEFLFVVNATGNTSENVGYNSLHWTFSPQNSSPGETWGRCTPNKSFYDWAHGTYQDDPRLNISFVSIYERYKNNTTSGEYTSAYPFVTKLRKDTIGWKDSIIFIGRPPIKVPIVKTSFEKIDSIDYRNFTLYADPRNPKISELDSTLLANFAKTKGASDWNINDWPYFNKHYTTDCTGRYANNNLYIYRYADFLLLMADVENELGNKNMAIDLANKVLYRARRSGKAGVVSTYPKDWAHSLSPEEVRESIFHERIFELLTEYDGFIDTRRRGIAWRQKILERNNQHEITKACYEYGIANDYKAYWREYWYPNDGKESWNTYLIRNQLLPIPMGELSTNSSITIADQNPGY